MKIGSVFDQTSTTEFVVMLQQQYDGERLLFSYVELSPDGEQPKPKEERIIARIVNVYKENPLLSRDQAGVSASIDIGGLGFNFARRFTYGWAKCSVLGTLTARGLDINRRGVSPNANVYTPSEETLRQLFFNPAPSYLPIGAIETFDSKGITDVPVTLNADQLATKHFCIFGMTGSGKTTTAAKLLEEFMARGHRMVIFDSHDDYQNLESFNDLFRNDSNHDGSPTLTCRVKNRNCEGVRYAINKLQPTPTDDQKPLNEWVCERLIRTASVVYANEPGRRIIKNGCQPINTIFVDQLLSKQACSQFIKNKAMCSFRVFPELKFYGENFADYTIVLLQAFQGEKFSSAQWRGLRQSIKQNGTGIAYLQNLYSAIGRSVRNESTKDALQQMLNGIQNIYRDAANTGATPLDLEEFFRQVADKSTGSTECVYRLSLSDLSSNLRKAMVYGVVTYFFRSFKFGSYSVRPKPTQKDAYPVLFVLEEARSLIPKSSGNDDDDVSGSIARRAMRELAYEGRKFSIGYGIISQKPSTIDQEVVSQANTFILHQLKSPDDQDYVRSVTETMSRDELDMVKSLGTGRAIVAGVAVQSPVLLRVYPRYSEEGIQEPTPVSDALKIIGDIREDLKIKV